LILALFLHHSHPHPKVPILSLPKGHKFGPTLLISPAAPVVTTSESMISNNGKDIFTPEMIKSLWQTLQSHCDPEVELANPWFTPTSVTIDNHWYENLPVGTITILAGEREIFRDDIVRIAEAVQVSGL
jgi:hypothetical protein